MKRKLTVYLAGPMRGKPYLNFLQFDACKASLETKGLRVLSPADIDRKHGFDPLKSLTKNSPKSEDCLIRDAEAICQSDAVVLLPGRYTQSRGAMAEIAMALFLNKPVYQMR